MQTKIEGILISKVRYRDRDLICHLLLRSGKQISVMFYGGQGGGKKMKSSLLELGFMLAVELRMTKSVSDLYIAKEWSVQWHYSEIRKNHQAFYLLCFYLELVSKIALLDHLHDEHREFDKNGEGVFRALSNAIFYLEESLLKDRFVLSAQMFLFLSRLIFELGVLPLNDSCLFCTRSLNDLGNIELVFDQGGFACATCLGRAEDFVQGENVGKMTWSGLIQSSQMAYRDYERIVLGDLSCNILLLDYLCYQFNLKRLDLKSPSFVF